MGNSLKKILVWSEATPDVIPSNPKCYLFKTESFGITATQASVTNNEMGN